MKHFTALVATVVLAATGCSVDSAGKDDNAVNVVIGYQSKTINTVTAGTLLRAQGYPSDASTTSAPRRARSTTSNGRTMTPVRRSPRRWSPRRSTSARWVTTRC